MEFIAGYSVEHEDKVLQALAIEVDRIMQSEIFRCGLVPKLAEVYIYNIASVGVGGDGRTYKHPAEITLKEPKHINGRPYTEQEFNDFLGNLSIQVTNNVKGINRVVFVTGTRDDRSTLLDRF